MKYYGFDDVRVIPIASKVNSRDDVDLTTKLGNLELRVPIIASPMKGITSPEVVIEVAKAGGIGILHKFYDRSREGWHKKDVDLFKISKEVYSQFGMAISLDYTETDKVLINDYDPAIICIDVANGYLDSVKKKTSELKNFIEKSGNNGLVMVGNVITKQGCIDLTNAGADLVRCGISTGQLCITGDVTGVSMPPISMLESCSTPIGKYWQHSDSKIIMDGGIRNSGDIVKSLIAGADAVMIGSLFGRCEEADHQGQINGMASEAHQLEYYHTTKSIEGISKAVEKDTTVKNLMNELSWGIKSGCTYVNARNIEELKRNGKFIYLD